MTTSATESAWTVRSEEFPYGGNAQCRYEYLVHYAILAPSSHNSQPWLFRASNEGLDLYADPTRALPVVDPHNRALIISCGAALEFLCVAARSFGYLPHVNLLNPGDHPDFLARFSFGERKKADEHDLAIFNAIPLRHTCRKKFHDTPVPNEIVQEALNAARIFGVGFVPVTDDDVRQNISRLVGEGDRLQAADPAFRRELAAWLHFNRSFSKDGMPGYAHGAGNVASLFGPLAVRTFDWGKGQAANDQQLVTGSPLLAAFFTNTDKPADWLASGRALARTLLILTRHGLKTSFLNQPIEVADLRGAFREVIGENGYPQLLLRIGYGPESNPTPRRLVEDVLLEQEDA